MRAHSNALQVNLELFVIAIGLPVGGLLLSVFLWRETRRRNDNDELEYVVLGLRSTAFAFAAYLLWLALTVLPGRYHTAFASVALLLLSMAGAIAAGSGLLLLLINGRGPVRISGALLALLALAYAVGSGAALFAGGAAP